MQYIYESVHLYMHPRVDQYTRSIERSIHASMHGSIVCRSIASINVTDLCIDLCNRSINTSMVV